MGMGMGMARGHGGAAFGLMRSFRRDGSVIHQQLPPGIVGRIAAFRGAVQADARGLSRAHHDRRRDRRRQPVDLPRHHRQRDRQAPQRPSHRRPRPAGRPSGHRRCRALALATMGVGPHRRRAHLRHAGQGVRPHPTDACRLLHSHPDRGARLPAEQRRARGTAGLHRHVLVGGEQRDRGGHHPGGSCSTCRGPSPWRLWFSPRCSSSPPVGSGGGWPPSPARATR